MHAAEMLSNSRVISRAGSSPCTTMLAWSQTNGCSSTFFYDDAAFRRLSTGLSIGLFKVLPVKF
jgi:hypothetical protein